MKKILMLMNIFLTGGISFSFNNFVAKKEDNYINQVSNTVDPYIYNTNYTHFWNRKYMTVLHHKKISDSSNTYYAGKWSKYAGSWNEFIRKYNYFGFTNNSYISLKYNQHTIEFSTAKNNFWNPSKILKEYIAGKNTNIAFQISTGKKSADEAVLTLEVWYTADGEIYFKWNFVLNGENLIAKVSVHLPQIKFYS